MKTLYEVINIDLSQEFTKQRKLEKLKTLELNDAQLEIEVKKVIEDMTIPENDDRLHWIQKIGYAAGADLLTIGKVQPENMLQMASLSNEDFQECVKVATSSARRWNDLTVSAEQELNKDTVPSTML